MTKVLILGGTGMLGPYVVPLLDPHYDLLVTDVVPMPAAMQEGFRGDYRQVDVADPAQVMAAAEGMDAIINLSVLRNDRKLAFDVNTLGCYNMMEAAVAHGIRRIINTGPHFAVVGRTYTTFDYELGPDLPPQPGTVLYAQSKTLGMEICRAYAETRDLWVQTYLFCNFREPADIRPDTDPRCFAVSWQNAAEVFPLGLTMALESLPSRNETFFVFTDMPHGHFSNEKAKRILGWQPKEDISLAWHKKVG